VPYTLAKWALWLISAAVAGFVVRWMLRGLRRTSDAVPPPSDGHQVESPRAPVAALEPLIAERDELAAQLAHYRQQQVSTRRAAAAEVLQPADVYVPVGAEESPTHDSSVSGERDRLVDQVAEHVATIGELRARLWNTEARVGELQDALVAQQSATAPPDPDLEAGAQVLSEKVRFNDLTVVEGIGPKIADLLLTSGIKTWWQLHQTHPDQLRRVLADAGPRFQVQNPSTWPEQAGLLARGEWQQFKLLADRLQSGKLTD